ncbi:DinB family protein [Desmospora activa]|uniref:Putative damage-inducible protein DinB n=1 Tax=Desmospora activa DSM 45169 TaxID=1121389 RepID=A0A2T4ZDT1_9BACL|nr:DinB family protein [Desmospora activa]PTM60047.1 putative damage-inducible protein DinB [Desmospora activa DSM 45169]
MRHRALQMYDYHTWANKQVLDHLKQLPPNLYHQEIKSVFPSIAHVIAHIYVVDTIWFAAMQEHTFQDIRAEADRLRETMPKKALEEAEGMFNQLSAQYQAFFEQQHDMEKIVTTAHPRYGTKHFRLADLVHHVVNHGTYHRGNISAMLHQLGHKGVATDYIHRL